MTRLLPVFLLLLLAACGAVEEDAVIVEPVLEELPRAITDCGSGDGIGGTGCPAEP